MGGHDTYRPPHSTVWDLNLTNPQDNRMYQKKLQVEQTMVTQYKLITLRPADKTPVLQVWCYVIFVQRHSGRPDWCSHFITSSFSSVNWW